ncbi:Glycosyl transferase [Planctomycetales bacterium 10988]|nr:Glycosyl transferase [Planctomycetales bacterium 10988]
MKRMRLVFVTRRFWPLAGGTETVFSHLTRELARRGHQITILTIRWDAKWPQEIYHSGGKVCRIEAPGSLLWGTWRYARALKHWLRQHRQEYDLVYLSRLRHDAQTAINSGTREHFPVVLRAEGAGLEGDARWLRRHAQGTSVLQRCQQCQAIVTPSQATSEELLELGFKPEQLIKIPSGVPTYPLRTPLLRHTARLTFQRHVPRLHPSDKNHVSLFLGRLTEHRNLETLIAAWPQVLRKHAHAQLWIVGAGMEEETLKTQILELNLQSWVHIFGPFDAVDDLLMAADLYITPSPLEGVSQGLLEAMAAGLPIVAGDHASNREVLTPANWEENGAVDKTEPVGRLVSPDARSLAQGVCDLIEHPDKAQRLGFAARQQARHFSIEAMATAHEQLFAKILHATPSRENV